MADEKKRGYALIETVKTVLLAMLVVSLLALIVVYIGGTHIYQSMTDSEEKKVFDKLWSVQSGQRTEGLKEERLLPELIAYKLAGSEPMCSIADRGSTSELYRLITPCVAELFGSGSYCEELDPEEGKRLYAEAGLGAEFIYLRFHEPVLYQLIYAYASGKVTLSENDAAVFSSGLGDASGAYVSEMIIIPESGVAAHRFIAYALDGDGRCFRFRRDESAVASEFYISKLNDIAPRINTLPCGFSDDLRLDPMQLMVSGEIESDSIMSKAFKTTEFGAKDAVAAGILRLFGYNPDKLKGYDDDGAGVYYDSHSRIRLEEGRLNYQAVDPASGIELSGLLGYSADDGFSLFDKLAAADYLLTELSDISSALVGAEAYLCLGEVYTENGMLVIEYFYTYNNVRIIDEPAVRAVFGQETLCGFELLARSFEADGLTELSPPQSYVLKKLYETGLVHEGTTGATMRYVYQDGGAKWQLLLPGETNVSQRSAR